MHKSACSVQDNRRIIKISEPKSSTLYIENHDRLYYHVIKYDGCVVQNTIGADYLIAKLDLTSVCIIELKGSDIKQAYNQICATTAALKNTDLANSRKSAIIVNTSWPKASPTFHSLMQKYYSTHKGKLHAVRHKNTTTITEIL